MLLDDSAEACGFQVVIELNDHLLNHLYPKCNGRYFCSKLKDGGPVYTALQGMLLRPNELRSFSVSPKCLRMKVWYGERPSLKSIFDLLHDMDTSACGRMKWKICYKRTEKTFQLRLDTRDEDLKRMMSKLIGNAQLPFLRKMTFKDSEVVLSICKT